MTLDMPKGFDEWMRWVERRVAALEVRPRGSSSGIVAFQKGSQAVTFVTATQSTVAITFTPGKFSSAPNVHANINSTALVAAGWSARATNITSSGFTLLVFGPSAAWTNIPVMWSAFL